MKLVKVDIHKRSKEFVKEFRNISHSIVTDGQDVSELRKMIKEALIENADELLEIKGKEQRARKVNNLLNHRVALQKLNRHVAALETAGIVDIDMKKRYSQFKNLEKRYVEGNLTSDEIQKIKTVAKNKVQEIKTKRKIIIENNRELIKDFRDKRKEVVADIKDKKREVVQSIRDKRADGGVITKEERAEIRDDIASKKQEVKENIADKKEEIKNSALDKRKLAMEKLLKERKIQREIVKNRAINSNTDSLVNDVDSTTAISNDVVSDDGGA